MMKKMAWAEANIQKVMDRKGIKMYRCEFCGARLRYKDLDKNADGNPVCPHCGTEAKIQVCLGMYETETA